MIKKADIILAVAILIGTLLIVIGFALMAKDGKTVLITVDGELYSDVSIIDDKTIDVVTEFGRNTVIIKNGSVSVLDADCPDKYCISHIEIDSVGQTIVCLPHKLVIEIRGEGNG